MNRIHRLQNGEGEMASYVHEMKMIARDYFANIFSTTGNCNLKHVLSGVDRCITDSMNQMLTIEYTEEVWL